MKIAEKLRALRELEGLCRGLARGLSKAETVKLIREELDERISLPYLSQLEAGKRGHMTNTTRLLLARFFRVHPGFLVDDPDEFQQQVAVPIPDAVEPFAAPAGARAGAPRSRHDRVVAETLERLADAPDRRKALRLLHQVLAMPALMDRLLLAVDSRRR